VFRYPSTFPQPAPKLRHLPHTGTSFSIPCRQKSAYSMRNHPVTNVFTSPSSSGLWIWYRVSALNHTIPRSQIIAILVYVPRFFSYEVWTYFRIGPYKIFSSYLVVTQNIKLTAFYTPSHRSRWTFRTDHLSAVVSPHGVACHQMKTDSTTKVVADTIAGILIKTIWC